MNRRELLKRSFALGAAGLLLPTIEPVRKVWALDRMMIPQESLFRAGDRIGINLVASNFAETGTFDVTMPSFDIVKGPIIFIV